MKGKWRTQCVIQIRGTCGLSALGGWAVSECVWTFDIGNTEGVRKKMCNVFIVDEPRSRERFTQMLQQLIDRCAESGGGQVRLTAGVYEIGTICLKKGVELYLDAGAVLRGSADPSDYSHHCPAPSPVEGVPHWYNAMITAVNSTDVAVAGEGIIDGVDCIDLSGEQGFRGPHVLFFYGCENVRVEGVTVLRAACYSMMFERCRNVRVQRVSVRGGQDGVRLGVCRDVEIAGCDIRSGDDCIGGSGNADVRILDTALNTPGGSTLMFSCAKLEVRRCVFWSAGQYPAVFKSEKRYSVNQAAICAGMDYGYPRSKDSDEWLFEDVVFENSKLLFRYEYDLYDRVSIPVCRVEMVRCRAVNLVYPSLIRGGDGCPTELVFRNCAFECASDDPACEGVFLRGDNFAALRMDNTILCGYCERPFALSGVQEVALTDVRLEKRMDERCLEGSTIAHMRVAPGNPSTIVSRFVKPGMTSVVLPVETDETFRGPMRCVAKPEVCRNDFQGMPEEIEEGTRLKHLSCEGKGHLLQKGDGFLNDSPKVHICRTARDCWEHEDVHFNGHTAKAQRPQ